MENLQILIGDLTVEQFCHVLGICTGLICVILLFFKIITHIVVNTDYLFYKTKEYYGSLRYLNKRFKELKTCDNIYRMGSAYYRLISAIELLRYQYLIPKFLYERLYDKAKEIVGDFSDLFLLEQEKQQEVL